MTISPVKIWRRQKEIRLLLGLTGKVVSWTYINIPPVGFRKNAPYAVVLVEFEDKNRAFGQLVDASPGDIRIGMKVKSILRKVRDVSGEDVIPYGLKFRKTV